MSARGETEHADAMRVEIELPGAVADGADGARDVQKRVRVSVARREAIGEDESGDAALVEEPGDRLALVRGEVLIPAAGADDDRGSIGFLRTIDLHTRDVRRLVADGAGRPALPQSPRG